MTVFFLSDYGTQDEFVGVVHAVLAAASPGLTIIDLTHHIPVFDVRAGSHTLVRASPHLGPGVHQRANLISECRLEADDGRDLVARDLEDPR